MAYVTLTIDDSFRRARLDADPGVDGKRLGKESREALHDAKSS